MCSKSAVLAWTGARKQSSPAPSLPCPKEAMALFRGEAEGGGHYQQIGFSSFASEQVLSPDEF